MKQRAIALNALLIAIVVTTSLTAAKLGPQGVSPGATDRLAGVSATCPTFTWEAAPGAQRYELVVYRMDPTSKESGALNLVPENEVLFTTVSGRASAWTPDTNDCFISGESYVWFVRAVTDAETGDGSEWSEPRFFQVAAAPSAEELERAIEVIRRWEAAGGRGSLPLSPDAVAVADAAADSGSGTGTGSGSSRPKSVITGTAAIRGEQPDASGETYGVVGTSASPDGAGIGAANTAGGPDLVLDGAVPAEITEAGVDRASASPQSFSFTNTGGGGMTLDIAGVEVVTTATDQDTIGNLSCGPGELAKWNGANWVCGPDLDTNTDTLAALAPCAFGEVAKWTGSAWECYTDWDLLYNLGCGSNQIARHNGTGWECADQSSIYDLGPGLILDGDQIRIDQAAFSTRVSKFPSSEDDGTYTSIAIGADGLGLISYHDDTNGKLMVAHCNDTLCSSLGAAPVFDFGSVGRYTSIAIGADGLGLISYYDDTNEDLKVAHCTDLECTPATVTTLDSTGNVGRYTSIAIGADGLGLISYHDDTNGNLKVAHCNDVSCSSATIATLDSADSVGSYTSIVIGSDGLGLISYFDSNNDNLKVAHCNDVACSSASIAFIDIGGHVGSLSSIDIGADGLGLISYRDNTNDALKVAHCDDITCSTASTHAIANLGSYFFGDDTSIVIGADGLGIISYTYANSSLNIARCNDVACSSATVATVDSWDVVGQFPSIAIGTDGLGLISYFDDTNRDLKVAHLGIGIP